MSKRRIFGAGVLVMVVGVVLVAAVAVWGLLELGRSFEEALLGPRDQRQRIEVPGRGFAVSVAGDWTAEIPPPDAREDERLGMRALLTIDPGEEDVACATYVAAGAVPLGLTADGERSDSEVLGDSAARLLAPWFEEQGLLLDEGAWGGTVGDGWGSKAGLSFGEAPGLTGAAWIVPHAEDLYVLTCTWMAGPEAESHPEFWDNPHQLMLALEPIADSFEFLPAAQSGMGGDGGGRRVEMAESRIALTFPDDWTVEETPATDSEGWTWLLEPEGSDLTTTVISAVPPTMHDRCVVVDLAALVHADAEWAALDDVVDGFLVTLGDDPRWVGLESTFLDLPAGRTGHVQRALHGEAESVSTYFFTQEDAWFLLECVLHTVPPEDGLSIAETFEFLRAGDE